jgi:Abnormal spindle-like microcephaly-assoc'd, ASPM-SPD-2-Hydin/NHL repeat
MFKSRTFPLALLAMLVPMARADQGSFTNSGGSASANSGISIRSAATLPAGTLTLSCAASTSGACSGGSFAYASNDGTTVINASFTTGTYAEACSGGGKGGHVTCGYTFTGYFSGLLTANGSSQAIDGVTSQAFGTSGAGGTGRTGYNSAYAPFYYSDSAQILRSDDLMGTNQIAYGSQGSGTGQFYGAYGIAIDPAGRIYIADTYNCRIVRIDDLQGTNWTVYPGSGGCGSGTGQFTSPTGIAIDSMGRIYVMDSGTSQLVRMGDMSGANWTVFSSIGSATGQLATYTNVAVDSSFHIYVADTANKRIVRMEDMIGTNFTTLSQSPVIGTYTYSFTSPVAVTVDSAGKIYIADNTPLQPSVIRVDDITGANWASIYAGGSGLNSISVDSSGTVFAGGGGVRIVDGEAGVLSSSGAIAPLGPYYVFGVTPVLLPSPRPSAIGFSPSTLNLTQNVGTSSSLPIRIANFGGSPLSISAISANGGFTEADDCIGKLTAGANCTVSVTFAPAVTGPASGLVTVSDDSGNLGAVQTLPLSGMGTAPAATVTPAAVSFSSTVVGSTSTAKTVTLQSTGTGTLTVSYVAATPPFYQTNTCTSIPPGGTCAIGVTFSPTAVGSASGSLTVTGNAGIQTAALTGAGSALVSLSATNLGLGTVKVGKTSTAKTVTLTNNQTVSLTFNSILPSTGFAISSNTCGTSIAGGARCSVGVTFTPTATGAASGALTFTDSAPNSPQTVTLTGTGK